MVNGMPKFFKKCGLDKQERESMISSENLGGDAHTWQRFMNLEVSLSRKDTINIDEDKQHILYWAIKYAELRAVGLRDFHFSGKDGFTAWYKATCFSYSKRKSDGSAVQTPIPPPVAPESEDDSFASSEAAQDIYDDDSSAGYNSD